MSSGSRTRPRVGAVEAGREPQERRLPGAVLAHDPDELAASDRERDVAQRPALLAAARAGRAGGRLTASRRVRGVPARIGLPDVLEADPVGAHR